MAVDEDKYRILTPEERPTDLNDPYYTEPFKGKSGKRTYKSKYEYDLCVGKLQKNFGILANKESAAYQACHSPEAHAKASVTMKNRFAFASAAKMIAQMPLEDRGDDAKIYKLLTKAGVVNPTQADAILFAQAEKAKSGDTMAAQFVRDTAGEKPSNQVEVGVYDKPIGEIDLAQLSEEELITLAESQFTVE